MPESRLQKLRKESERYSTDIKEKEADNNVFRKQIREIKSTIHQTQRDYHATAKGTSKAENQRIKMQKLLKRQKLANEVNAQEKEIAELRLELKRLSKKTFPQFDDTLWCLWQMTETSILSYEHYSGLRIETFQSNWISTSFYSFSNLPKRSIHFIQQMPRSWKPGLTYLPRKKYMFCRVWNKGKHIWYYSLFLFLFCDYEHYHISCYSGHYVIMLATCAFTLDTTCLLLAPKFNPCLLTFLHW